MAGLRLHQAGRLAEALAMYRQVLAREPTHPDARHMPGLIEYQLGNAGRAIELIDAAVQQAPDDPFALNNLGEASDCYRQAIAANPANAETHNNLGVALAGESRIPEALESYRQAISIRPDLADGHVNLGNAFKDMGNMD